MFARKYPHLTLLASATLFLAVVTVAALHPGAADLITILSVVGAIIAAIGIANVTGEIIEKAIQQ
nr:MAG TPA: hypothetical protein [Caudoviricetes sp.]